MSGESAATKLQYLSIKNGNMVWFVWANFNKSSDPKYNEVFEIMKASLRLGEGLPQRLQDIYGELFEPLPLPLGSLHVEQIDATRSMVVNSSQWDVPVYGNWTVNCGSPYHTNGASHSADIAAYQYTDVVAARGGSVLFSGWDNSGYGNLIKLDTSGYYHYYAHLQSIHSGNFTNGWYAAKDVHIGDVGGTGDVPVHLHFHVQTGSSTQSSATLRVYNR